MKGKIVNTIILEISKTELSNLVDATGAFVHTVRNSQDLFMQKRRLEVEQLSKELGDIWKNVISEDH